MLLLEFDEEEFLNGALEDDALHLVTVFCGCEVKDKLLYEGKKEYEIDWYGGFIFLEAKQA